jgi:hypothetical protein
MPGSGGEVAVPPIRASAVDLGQPSQPLRVDQLRGPLELGEVLLNPRARQLRQALEPHPLDGRAELTHGLSFSNICSDAAKGV